MEDLIVLKTRTDALVAIAKLSQYRQSGDIQNYKSLSDSLEILVNIHNKNAKYSQHKHGLKEVFKQMISILNDEISLLTKSLDDLFEKDDIRDYRNQLISLEKLNNVHRKLKSELEHICWIETLNKTV